MVSGSAIVNLIWTLLLVLLCYLIKSCKFLHWILYENMLFFLFPFLMERPWQDRNPVFTQFAGIDLIYCNQ